MSQATVAAPGKIKHTPILNAKLMALYDSVSSRFPEAEFSVSQTGGGNDILYIKNDNHCLRIEKRFVGYGFTDIGDKQNLSLGPDCEFKEDLPLLTRHVVHYLDHPRRDD